MAKQTKQPDYAQQALKAPSAKKQQVDHLKGKIVLPKSGIHHHTKPGEKPGWSRGR